MALKRYLTTCPLDCFDCCSLAVTVDEKGEVLNIEGNREHPVTRGFICEKGRKHMERVHHPSRLRYPMRKINGEWQRISWDEALDTITEKMKYYMKEYGNKAIGLYSYGGAAGLLKNIEDLFFEYLGGTTQICGSICWGAGTEAQNLDFGKPMGHSPEDMSNSGTILIWGRNPADTNIHLMPYLKAAKERGASLILVDPLRTATAGVCSAHIRVKPEGDAALACAVAKYVVEKGLHDRAFVENNTLGFPELHSFLREAGMEELSEACGVSLEDIAMLAERLTSGKPATVYIGYGLQRYPYGGTAVRCIDMLMALTGNIGIAGGGANYSNGGSSRLVDTNPFRVKGEAPRLINRASFGTDVKALNDPPLKLLFISRSNPAVQLPNTNEVVSAIESIELKVSLEHFLTDTAQLADIVLPVTYFFEEEDAAVPGMWSHYVGRIGKCLDRFYEAKPEYEIYAELAERLGCEEFPRLTGGQWLELMLKPMLDRGLKLEELKEKGYTHNPISLDIPWQDRQFATGSGRFELVSAGVLEKYLRHVRSGDREKYRLIFVHSRKSLHSQHMMDEAGKLPTVYFHQEDAELEGIKPGDTIRLFNAKGSIEAVSGISASGTRRVLYMEQGWWLKSGGGVNRLTSDGISDIGNQGIMNHCFCDIKKVRIN